MRLKNLLEQPGGVYQQGRAVKLRVLYADRSGVPMVRDLDAVMMPVSERGRAAATEAATKAVAAGEGLPQGAEEVLQLMRASLRDPADLARGLIEDETDLRALRSGLIGAQYDRLLDEYQRLISDEYPENPTPDEERAMEEEARGFSGGGQPGPG